MHGLEDDQKLPQGRLTVLWVVIVLMTLVVLIGFWRLQVLDTQHYAELANRNAIRNIPIIAPRGLILDRSGHVLLGNYPSFSVLLNRDSPKVVKADLPEIAAGLGIALPDLKKQLSEAAWLPRYQPLVIKTDASQADVAFVESHQADIPCLNLLMVQRRKYPADGYMAHVLGYVGDVSPKDIANSHGRYQPGDMVGKTGLERQYNNILMGTDGSRRVIVDSRGVVRGTLDEIPAVPGKTIHLTIDNGLEQVAEHDLQGKDGAVVALDPQTGAVLAMASQPSFNANELAGGPTPAQWNALVNNPDHPLLNRAIQAQLAPGSVFKIIMAVAMLKSGVLSPNFTVDCRGSQDFYGRIFHCWDASGHGIVSLHNAIVESCDIFFYNVGMHLGIDRIAYYAKHLGLGKRTGIDLPGEEPGLVPSAQWKKRVYHQPWYPGETISVSIGQGATEVTPLQLAYTIGGIAMGGDFKRPHLRKLSGPDPEYRFPISPTTVNEITDAMYGVVNSPLGTAAGQGLKGIQFCGKTGTAQLVSDQYRNDVKGGRKKYVDNAWFVGFAPRQDPKIVVSVLVQAGVEGALSAAPIARDVVQEYYRERPQDLQQLAKKGSGSEVDTAQTVEN